MYVFVNRRRDMVKMLWRDATGWCLLSKRFDEREAALPTEVPAGASSIAIDGKTLAALLDGVVRRRAETPRDIAREGRAAASRVLAQTDKTINV